MPILPIIQILGFHAEYSADYAFIYFYIFKELYADFTDYPIFSFHAEYSADYAFIYYHLDKYKHFNNNKFEFSNKFGIFLN